MTSIFAQRRQKLLAMKAFRDGRTHVAPAGTACPGCGQTVGAGALAQSQYVCPHCGYHLPLGGYFRLSTILDPGSFRELNARLTSSDPLHFPGYPAKLEAARKKTGLNEAVVTAVGTVDGRKCVAGVLDGRFFLGSMGAKVRAVQGNVADSEAVKALMDTAVKEFGHIHILVNNAGITRDGLAMMMKEEDFDAVIDTNLKGTFLCMENLGDGGQAVGGAGGVGHKLHLGGVLLVVDAHVDNVPPDRRTEFFQLLRCHIVPPYSREFGVYS